MSEPVFDATATATPATATSLTWSHTNGSGVPTDGALLAWCRIGYVSQTDPLVSAKYNSVDAAQIVAYGFVGDEWVYLARWASPAAGAHNVVFDFGSASAAIAGMSVSYTNAAQGNLNATSRLGLTAQAAMLGTITATIADCWVGVFASNSLEVPTVGFNSTIIGTATQRATLSQRNAPVAANVEVYPWLTTSTTADWMAISFALGPFVAPVTPPPPGNPNTSREAIAKPTLPVLGAAGFQFTEPTFGSPMIRVTDRNTGSSLLSGQVDHSWSPPSAVSQRGWNSNATKFYGINRNGSVLLFNFNTTTYAVSERELLGGGMFGEPSFSQTNPNYLYGAGGNNHKLCKRADFSTSPATYTTVFDAEVLIPALSVGDTYLYGGFTTDNDVFLGTAGGSNQDLMQYVIWYPLNDPSSKKILNTRTRTEMFKTYGVGPTLHAAQPDMSGRYVLLRVSDAQQLDGNIHRSDWAYVWDTTLDTITEITASADGHYTLGYGFMVNQAIVAGHPYDNMQWVKRDLATPNIVTELITPLLTPQYLMSEDHTSLCASHAANPYVSAVSLTYRDWDGPYAVDPNRNTEANRAWNEEIIKIPTDGGGGPVRRFGFHRTLSWPEPLARRGGITEFYATPLFNVSPDGKFCLFNSNWEHSLGLCAHDYDPTIHRTDMFICVMDANESAPTPPAPLTHFFRRRRGRRMGSR